MTWEEIAQLIRDKGVRCTRQGVQDYFVRRRRKPKYAIGMEPEEEAPLPKNRERPVRTERPDIKETYLKQRETQQLEPAPPLSPIE